MKSLVQICMCTGKVLIVISFLIFGEFVHAQGFLKAQGREIVNARGQNVLLRGMGLGGWMLQEGYMLGIYKNSQQHNIKKRIEDLIGSDKTATFYNAWLNNFIRKTDIDSMHAWGFNSVRLPLHFNLFTLPSDEEPVKGKNTWLKKGFQLTDSVLAWCKADHIYLILDLHAAPGGQGNDLSISDRDGSKPSLWQNKDDQEKTVALWKKLAARYKDETWIGGYDILNEPNWGFTDPTHDPNGLKETNNGPLKKLLVQITAAIRSVDKQHIIIIEGNGWGNNYNGVLPAWDKNMVLSFHKYWNYNRQQDIQKILDTRDKYNVPVWLGETGENSNTWFTEVVRLLEDNNIGWSMWPLKKMGNNNPLQIRSNPDYDSLRKYLNDDGPKPNSKDAYKGLMRLANDAKCENNIYHKDVIDALFRQPFSTKTVPFQNFELKNSLAIPAINYDLGRNGYAYYDLDTADYHDSDVPGVGNRGRLYRNDGVDIFEDSLNNELYVGDFETGEWLQYTVDVSRQGDYQISFVVAAGKEPGQLKISNNGTTLGEVDIAGVENSLGTLKTLAINNIYLHAGWNHLRVYALKGGFNFYSFTISK
jgi:endoglucanase